MAISFVNASFAAGELSPSLWGRVDLARWHIGCATLRNCFVNYRGGISSRAGSLFVGQCKQPASAASTPPRDIPFRFNIYQNYVLELGDLYMRFKLQGGYVTEAPLAITAISQANPGQMTVPGHAFANGDWVAAAGIAGMTALNGLTFVVANANIGSGTFTLLDTFGVPVNTLALAAYVSGGTVARIYTIATPYAAADLDYLKYTQSADTMSLTCVNPLTGTEYPQYDLKRLAAASWTLTPTTFGAAIAAPASVTATPSTTVSALASANNAPAAQYAYVVTAVNAAGQESVASPVAYTPNSSNSASSVDIAATAGSVTVTWAAVAGAAFYNIYKGPAAIWNTGSAGTAPTQSVPVGSFFGYAGSAFGPQWVDGNVVANITTTPPLHLNPFARGQVLAVGTIPQPGSFAQATTSATITTATGSGAVIVPVVISGNVAAAIIQNAGANYQAGDTVTFNDSGGATTGPVALTIGPQSGTYPGLVAYLQQRRTYGSSTNNPDTFWGSQPGLYGDFDAASPPTASDAVTFTPWSSQVNGVQWLVAMSGGGIALTGLDAWLITGASGVGSPIGPGSINVQPQESNGASPILPPLKINYHLLYVQALGSIVRDVAYNYINNTFAGDDISQYANHLFDGHTLRRWAWAREPWKIVWAVRDDGKMLSLTYLKEQEVLGWGRHDTNGLYVGVVSAAEPPVDAVYTIVKRFIAGKQRWAYYSERTDNRLWTSAEGVWAVDCGLAYSPAQPAASISPAAASGTSVAFVASAAVFDGVTIGVVGQVIRAGGGKATVTAYVAPTQVLASVTVPITDLMPNDPGKMPKPQPAGQWSIGTPVTAVAGLNHLEGMKVSILADGVVVPQQVVTGGQVSLPFAASQVVAGLPFQAQMQTLDADNPGGPTIQGKRKRTVAVTLRMERSRGVKVGINQPNASEQEGYLEPVWGQGTQTVGKMIELKAPQAGITAGQYLPLFTGDLREQVDGDWDLTGRVAFQQDYPLPMNVLASIPEIMVGDDYG